MEQLKLAVSIFMVIGFQSDKLIKGKEKKEMAKSLIKIDGTPLWDDSIPGIGSLGYTYEYKPTSGAINMKFEAPNNGGIYYLPFCKDGSTIEGWTKLSDSLRITKDNSKYVPYRKLQKVTLSSSMTYYENAGAEINRDTGKYDSDGYTYFEANVNISKEFPDDFTYWAIDWDNSAFSWGINVTIGAWKGISTAIGSKIHNFPFGGTGFLCAARSGNSLSWYARFQNGWFDIRGYHDMASCLTTTGDALFTKEGGMNWYIPIALTTSYIKGFTCDVTPKTTEKKIVPVKHQGKKHSSGSGTTYHEWYEYYYTASVEVITEGRTGYWHCYF